MSHKIGFIGAGHMGRAIIEGLLKSTLDCTISVYEHNPDKVKDLNLEHKIQLCSNCIELCSQSDIIIIAVKPQSMKQTLEQCIGFDIQGHPLFVSVAAGITTKQIKAGLQLNEDYPVVRAMPNTPATLQLGMTGLYGSHLTSSQKDLAESVMQSIGCTVWLEQEAQMDLVTAISGSGPAYFYYFCEQLILAGQQLGLSEQVAEKLVLETAIGALAMAKNSKANLKELRTQVTSPGGTTEAGLKTMMSADLSGTLLNVIKNAAHRGKELSQQLDP